MTWNLQHPLCGLTLTRRVIEVFATEIWKPAGQFPEGWVKHLCIFWKAWEICVEILRYSESDPLSNKNPWNMRNTGKFMVIFPCRIVSSSSYPDVRWHDPKSAKDIGWPVIAWLFQVFPVRWNLVVCPVIHHNQSHSTSIGAGRIILLYNNSRIAQLFWHCTVTWMVLCRISRQYIKKNHHTWANIQPTLLVWWEFLIKIVKQLNVRQPAHHEYSRIVSLAMSQRSFV